MSPDASIGVPADLVTANDFVQVRLALLEYLGGALEAILFTRIVWRTRAEDRSWVEHEGRRWWTVTVSELALEMGHSERQVRRALDSLVKRTAVRREQLRDNGPYDQRYSYTAVITEVTKTSDRADENDKSQVTKTSNVPLLREGEHPPTPQAESAARANSLWAGEECDVRRPRGPHELDADDLVCVHCDTRNPQVTDTEYNAIVARRKLTALHHDHAPSIPVDELLEHADRIGDGDLLAGVRIVRQIIEQPLPSQPRDPGKILRSRLRTNCARRVQDA